MMLVEKKMIFLKYIAILSDAAEDHLTISIAGKISLIL